VITAAIFVPSDIAEDVQVTIECIEYIQHRGYTFGGIFREASTMERAFRNSEVSLVVFARVKHGGGYDWPAEYVDGCTRRLKWNEAPAGEPGKRRGAIHWGRERVRQVLDGSGPVPRGLNEDAIAAARRIAAHLSHCHNW
jgi:hypothetical protein